MTACSSVETNTHKKERSRGRNLSNKASKSHRPLDHLVAERTNRLAQVKDGKKRSIFT
jgi:hypothetical protein